MSLNALTQIGQGFGGIGCGFSFTSSTKKEDEIRQGQNHLLSAFPQVGQLGVLCAVIRQVAMAILGGTVPLFVSVLSNVVPILSLPLFLLAGSARGGEHNKTADALAEAGSRWSYVVPRNLSDRTLCFLSGIAQYSTHVFRVAMVISAVALVCLGSHVFGISLLFMLLYREIDKRGYIPHKVSLFIETYMPIVSIIGALVVGTLVIQVFAVLSILSYIRPVQTFLQHKIDAIVGCFLKKGVSLQEYEAPLIEKRGMTYEEISHFLEGRSTYELNPAHCSKPALTGDLLPENRNFNEYLSLFESVNWKESKILVKKLQDDDRFRDFLRRHSTEGDLEARLKHVASSRNVASQTFAANWAREQMETMVQLLSGKVGTSLAGNRSDLETAIPDYARILAYLKSDSVNPIVKEDLLLKIAVEGGHYCARGIKNTASEIMRGHLVKEALSKLNGSSVQHKYETLLKFGLQNERHRLIQEWYYTLIKAIKAGVGEQNVHDVHFFDLFLQYLNLGFYPLSAAERSGIGLPILLVWRINYQEIRERMHLEYELQLSDFFKSQREDTNFFPFLKSYLKNFFLKHLENNQQETLLERLEAANDKEDTFTIEQFQRLALVGLGILREQPRNAEESIPLTAAAAIG